MTLVRYLFKFICTPTSVYKLFKVSDSSTYTYIHIYIHVQLFSLLLVKLSYLAIKNLGGHKRNRRRGGSGRAISSGVRSGHLLVGRPCATRAPSLPPSDGKETPSAESRFGNLASGQWPAKAKQSKGGACSLARRAAGVDSLAGRGAGSAHCMEQGWPCAVRHGWVPRFSSCLHSFG